MPISNVPLASRSRAGDRCQLSASNHTPGWAYGFPEWRVEQPQLIAQAKRVSNPGCYPTGAVGVLAPLVRAGFVPRDHPVTIDAVSGYSGQGRAGLDLYERGSGSKRRDSKCTGWGSSTNMYRRSGNTQI
jgi:N-acetyl-gamma-glutamylphosphate reductase